VDVDSDLSSRLQRPQWNGSQLHDSSVIGTTLQPRFVAIHAASQMTSSAEPTCADQADGHEQPAYGHPGYDPSCSLASLTRLV
jgi:hypothetical protein